MILIQPGRGISEIFGKTNVCGNVILARKFLTDVSMMLRVFLVGIGVSRLSIRRCVLSIKAI